MLVRIPGAVRLPAEDGHDRRRGRCRGRPPSRSRGSRGRSSPSGAIASRRADLRRLVPGVGPPEAKLTLPLKVEPLLVEPAADDHQPVEIAQRLIGDRLRALSLRRQHAILVEHRRDGVVLARSAREASDGAFAMRTAPLNDLLEAGVADSAGMHILGGRCCRSCRYFTSLRRILPSVLPILPDFKKCSAKPAVSAAFSISRALKREGPCGAPGGRECGGGVAPAASSLYHGGDDYSPAPEPFSALASSAKSSTAAVGLIAVSAQRRRSISSSTFFLPSTSLTSGKARASWSGDRS